MKRSLCTLVLLLAAPSPAPAAQEAEREALRSLAVAVRSIDPTDEDFSDLAPLASAIGDARIVVLGESTHAEGTTSRAKARVVRFLHARMGFDVLAWESGLAQAHAMNAKLRDPSVPLDDAKSYLMSGGWAHEEGIDPLFAYARRSWATERPLAMAGFDSGRPHRAAPYVGAILSDLFERAPFLAFDERERALATSLLQRGFGFLSSETADPQVRAEERAVLETLLRDLERERDRVRVRLSDRELELVRALVAHALRSEEVKELRGLEWNAARDRSMADALLWLSERLYPGRKIVVWAATAHFARNTTRIENRQDETLYATPFEAGNHLGPVLGDDLYTLAFTSYGGSLGDVFPEGYGAPSSVRPATPAPPGSFEAVAHELGAPFLFVDLRGAPPGPWSSDAYVSLALGRLENVAPWREVVDGFFFVDQAEPVRYLPR